MSEIYDALDWLIVFEDADINPMPFTDESVARKAYEMKAQSWNCHLFYRVSSESGIDYPKAEIQKLQAKIDALVARVAILRGALEESMGWNWLDAAESTDEMTAEMLECEKVLNETELESLAHIQAECLIKMIDDLLSKSDCKQGEYISSFEIVGYANHLHQQGKDHD